MGRAHDFDRPTDQLHLKADIGQRSSTDTMIAVLSNAFATHSVTIAEAICIAAHDVKPRAIAGYLGSSSYKFGWK